MPKLKDRDCQKMKEQAYCMLAIDTKHNIKYKDTNRLIVKG